MIRNSKSQDIPIGSTQNVGASVRAGRVPAEYDSSPMLSMPSLNTFFSWFVNERLTIRILDIWIQMRF